METVPEQSQTLDKDFKSGILNVQWAKGNHVPQPKGNHKSHILSNSKRNQTK